MSVFDVVKPPPFIPRVIDNDGTPATLDAFQSASRWLSERGDSGWELASPIIVRGSPQRCTIDSGEPGGAIVFKHHVRSPHKKEGSK